MSGAWLGVLTYVIPPVLVDEAVGDGLAWEMRLRSLPARVTAYFVLGLCLFTADPYPAVIGKVTAGLGDALAAAGWARPASTALTAARRRLGEKPLESLFRKLCSPLSPGTAPWSHACGLLAVAWDGTTFAAAATPQNEAAFGRAGSIAGPAGPHLRAVVLMACGTRCLLDAALGPLAGKGTGERALARQLLGSLRPGMLLLADRNFWSFRLWNDAAATGAHLLWRIKEGKHVTVTAALPDGSRIARVEDPAQVQHRWHKNAKRRKTGHLPPDTSPLPGAVTVRVIDFLLAVTSDDGTVRTEPYRLFTTLLDHRAYPAADLAAAYARRWAIETGYRECKAYLRGSGRTLRGKTPDLARQEAWALLAVYQAIRTLIARAAAGTGADPGRISFTTALRAARATMTAPRSQLGAALDATGTEMLSALVPDRPGRIYPRAVRRKMSPYPARRNSTKAISQQATHTVTIAPRDTTTTTPHQQAKHPQTTTTQPP